MRLYQCGCISEAVSVRLYEAVSVRLSSGGAGLIKETSGGCPGYQRLIMWGQDWLRGAGSNLPGL